MIIRRSRLSDCKLLWLYGGLIPAITWLIVRIAGPSEEAWWQIMIFMAASIGATLAWLKIDWGGTLARFVSVGSVLLIALSLAHFLFALDVLLAGPRFHEWPVVSLDPASTLLKAEILSTSGVLLTISAWLMAGGKELHAGQIFQLDRALVEKTLWLLYFGSLIPILLEIANVDLGVFGQLAPTISGMAMVAALALPILRFKRRLPRVVYAGLLSMPMIYAALGRGMKENLILALFPVGFILWTSWKTPLERIVIALSAVIFLGLITTYVGFYRDVVWRTGTEAELGAVIGEFTGTASRTGLAATVVDGMESFTDRANASNYRSWAIAIADERGTFPELVFDPLKFVFIPRIFWPQKPEIRQGWEFTGLVYGERIQEMLTTSTAAGFYPALYLGGSYRAVFLGAISLGILLAVLARLAYQIGGRLFSSIYLFGLLSFFLRLEEQWTVQAIALPIIAFIYSYIVYLMVLFVVRIRPSRSKSNSGRTRGLQFRGPRRA